MVCRRLTKSERIGERGQVECVLAVLLQRHGAGAESMSVLHSILVFKNQQVQGTPAHTWQSRLQLGHGVSQVGPHTLPVDEQSHAPLHWSMLHVESQASLAHSWVLTQ